MNKKLVFMIGLLAVFLFIGGQALAASVDVYGEGAYTDTNFVVYIYADINDSNIYSFGVKLTYNPDQLTVVSAEKNTDVWFMGDSPENSYPYMNPDTNTPGEVIIIGGKLKTSEPTAGVGGTRVLLGKVTFTRNNTEEITGLSLTFAKSGKYKNFVTNDETPRILDDEPDGVAFGNIEIHERGDANGDGVISSADMFAIRNLGAGEYVVWADCNGDNVISSADMFCVRNK